MTIQGQPNKYAAGKILALLNGLQKIDSEFPLQYAICLMEIYLNEGLSLTELSKRTDMPLSTTSRIIGALSDHRQRGEPFNLIKVEVSKAERRRKELYLSKSGQQIIHDLGIIISQDEDQRLHA